MADNYKKLFHTLPDTGDETDYVECVQALNKYFEIRKNVPKERQNFLSVSPEGGETINNFISRLKKTVEHCEYGLEEENQIRDRVLYFIRDKVLKRKLFREENLSLPSCRKLRTYSMNQKRCCCHQLVREKTPTPSMQNALVVSALPKEHFKENVGNVTISDISQKTAANLKTTRVRNAEKGDILHCVAIPNNREVAPLADSHTVSIRMKAGGVVVESRTFEILTNKTLNWGKKIHSMCFQ